MSLSIEAVYENGVFRPAQPVKLPEQQRVRLTVESADAPTEKKPTVREILKATGSLAELSPHLRSQIMPGVTLEQVRESLAKAGGKPLSEIIIEQRGPRP